MKIINLQTKEFFSGEVYNYSTLFEGDAEPSEWVTTIKLDNGFIVKISDSELNKIHSHTHFEGEMVSK